MRVPANFLLASLAMLLPSIVLTGLDQRCRAAAPPAQGAALRAPLAEVVPEKQDSGYPNWQHSGSMWLLTGPEGADLPDGATVHHFPVLVRLHQDFFDFAQAQPDGDDLRFSSSTGERLAFQIEEWNVAQGAATVWVRVPRITGNSRQEIKLYWGNANAVSESNGRKITSSLPVMAPIETKSGQGH